MRRIFPFLLCLVPSVCFGAFTWNGATISGINWATVSHWNGVEVGGTPPPESPIYQYDLNDNAATTAVLSAIGGSNGVAYDTTTASLHSTSCYEGGGCFNFANATTWGYVNTPAIDAANFEDNDLTIQVSFYIPSSTTISSSVRLVSSSVASYLNVWQTSDTNLTFYYRGTLVGSVTVADMSDSTWQLMRFVYNSGTIKVYKGTSEANLSLVNTLSGTFGTATTTTTVLSIYGRGDAATSYKGISGVGDQFKIWDGVVEP